MMICACRTQCLNRFMFYINMKSESEHFCIVWCLQGLIASKMIIQSLGMCEKYMLQFLVVIREIHSGFRVSKVSMY